MNSRLYFIAFSVTILLCGCFGLFDSGSDRITGKFIVSWLDVSENQTLSEEVELNSSGSVQVVGPYVFAVGHNEDFIIVKQHPTEGFSKGFKIDTSITNYYIVNINRKGLPKSYNKIGPLTLSAFENLSRELKIENIPFDQVYPDKP